MYTNTTSLAAAWSFSASASSSIGSTGSSGTGEGDAFSKLFNSIKSGSQNGLDSMLGKLSERFPGLSFSTPAKGAAAGEETADSQQVKDTAKIDENALAEMSASQSFASMIEKALSSFLDATQNMQAMSGAYNQRSVSITVTTIRFSVSQVDSASGEKLTSQELQTALKEKLDEMIKKVFGVGAGNEATEETDESEGSENTKKTEGTQGEGNNFNFGMSWSMQLYYSNSYLQGSDSIAAGRTFSRSGSFSMQGFLGASLPQELNAIGNGESTMDSLPEMMLGIGMSVSSFSSTQDGISMRLAESRNLLSELLETLNQRQQTRIPAAPPAEEEDEDSAAEAAQEVEVAETAAE